MKSKTNFIEYDEIISPIINNPEFLKRKKYAHHGNISVYDHSLAVARLSYILARKLNLDYKSATIGGLLHDFYYKPWQENTKHKPLFKHHGFVHAREALENTQIYFPELLNEKIENIILRHMFPLNIVPPRFKEAWLVTLVDKYISFQIFKSPKQLPRYLGFKKKK